MKNLGERFECELPGEVRKRFEPVGLEPKRKTTIPTIPTSSRKGDRIWMVFAFVGLLFYGLNTFRAPPRDSKAILPSPTLNTPAQPVPPIIEVRRAERVAPRAGPVIGASYPVHMPDGQFVSATFRGYLGNAGELPLRGGNAGDMYGVGNAYWILTTPVTGGRLSWIDP